MVYCIYIFYGGVHMGDKFPLSFKDTEKEKELLVWINNKSEILGRSNFIKQILYNEMLKDKAAER